MFLLGLSSGQIRNILDLLSLKFELNNAVEDVKDVLIETTGEFV